MGKLFLATLLIVLLGSCANERDVKPVLANGRRVSKTSLTGTYLYLRSLSEVSFRGADQFFAPGFYLDNDKLIQFVVKENSLDIVAIDPLYRDNSSIERNNILASFPVRHVDVLRKQNADGKDTHEEEETETRRPWAEREFIVVDLTKNALDLFKKVKTASPSEITVEANQRVAFSIQKQLGDDTLLREHYSFQSFSPSKTYEQKEYPKALQDRFGLFKTTTYRFDPYGRLTDALKREFMDRWDTSKPVVYYLSKNFPAHLKPMAQRIVKKWNDVMKEAIGKDLLELRDNSGQEVGDLRYNLIVYDESQTDHNLIGYGPSVVNPRTGEIIKADVFIYGGTLRKAIYNERRWGQLIGRGGGLSAETTPPRLFTPLELDDKGLRTPRQPIDVPLVGNTRAAHGIDATLPKTFRAQLSGDHLQRMTRLSDEMVLAVGEGTRKELSDEELELKIFTPLLTHELGHNLGLRHNFMGSADRAHFGSTAQSSSVMDYGFFASEEPMEPAPYDRAAIKIAYARDPKLTEQLVGENYFYCTDEGILDSRNGLCNDFDAGSTLADIVRNQMKRYAASYFFNNLRLDQVHFGTVDSTYQNHVLGYLLPLRLSFDHANAILRYGRAVLYGKAAKDLPAADLAKLWQLLKQRIEAARDLADAISVDIVPKVTVRLDPVKIKRAVTDAQTARQAAFGFFAQIIKDGERPEFDSRDPVYNDLQVRGVMTDKLTALRLIFARFADPLGDGGTSPFENVHEDAANLISGVLSTTDTTKELGGNSFSRMRVYEPTLREATLNYLTEQIQAGTIASGELKELIRFEKVVVNDPDQPKLDKANVLRKEYRALLVELNSNPPNRAQLEVRVDTNRKELRKLNLTSFKARDNLELKAWITLANFGNVETASGHLLQDNLGQVLDNLEVQETLLTKIEEKWKAETDPPAKEKLGLQRREQLDYILLLTRYSDGERSFAERLYRIYSPH